jgi:diguanylate cyclase (GGDEF)-like protein
MVARLGGDKFAIVVVEDYGRASAVEVADRVLAVLRTPFLVKGVRLAVSVSIGVAAQGQEDHSGAAELLAQAALATRLAKRGGRGRYQIFDAQSYDVRTPSGTARTSR